MVNSISFVKLSSDLLDELKEFANFDSFITDIHAKVLLRDASIDLKGDKFALFKIQDGILVKKGQMVPHIDKLIKQILVECHDVPSVGHLGVLRMYMLVKKYSFWPGMKSNVKKYVCGCLICQAVKVDYQKFAGLYHPLRDPKFKSKFWQTVFEKLETKLGMSTGEHPQSDG
ncbi:uncharacterized protein LOC112340634 [Selaginella moellendorffii]|uniref:uncharacterized protein LOC112340634 n=1 Tax=Selaginella moellendorffii TaxID=88036 RepID=UPI000D1C8AB0|nr:uncharacterized protein LOC112340634 [Selaginella moellendorffii]|eukprot:XP_024515214.1 uncharacterized protein LOC112340634 [Selaginella moellendorffii]